MEALHLPGITHVGFCKSSLLQPDVYDLIDELKELKVYGTFTNIPIVDLGSMSVESNIVKGVTLYTVKAGFTIRLDEKEAKPMVLELLKNNHSFFFENVNKQKLLVGTHEKPYPIVTQNYKNDDSPSGKRGYSLEVIYTNVNSFIVLR